MRPPRWSTIHTDDAGLIRLLDDIADIDVIAFRPDGFWWWAPMYRPVEPGRWAVRLHRSMVRKLLAREGVRTLDEMYGGPR